MTVLSVAPIAIGYPYTVDLAFETEDEVFASGGAFAAQVRQTAGAPWVIATLTSGEGHLTRVDDQTIRVAFTSAHTALMRGSSVVLDFVRTDTDPDQYLNAQATLPVTLPATRDLS